MKNRHLNLSKHLNRNSIQLNNWPVISCLAPLFKGLFGRWLSAASITTGMDSLFGQRCVAGECFSLYSFLRSKCSSLYSWPPNKDEWHEEQRPANVGFGRESVIFYLDFGNSHIVATLRPPDGILSLQSFMFLSIFEDNYMRISPWWMYRVTQLRSVWKLATRPLVRFSQLTLILAAAYGWVEEPDYKASHCFTFYRLTVSIVIEQIGVFHNLLVVKSNLVTLNPFQQLQVTANEMRAKKATRAGLLSQ